MEDFPRTTPSESAPDKDKESSSSTKKKDTSVRKIGAFAKITAESPAVPTDRTEARKSFFENKSEDKSAQKSESTEVAPTEADTKARKNELLQEHLDAKIEAHQEVIDSSTPGSAEHTQAVTAKELDESIRQKADNPDVEHDPLIEAEYAKLIDEMEIPEESDEITVEEAETTDSDEHQSTEPDKDDTTAIPLSGSTPTTALPITPNTPQPKPSKPNTPVPPKPTPPTPPPVFPPLPPIYNQPPNNPNNAGNVPPTAGPNVLRNPSTKSERSKKAGAFITGGILGYMVGRRGGRKRAERRLEPEIKKQATELEATKQRLESRELEIKKNAADTLRAKQVERTKQAPERASQAVPKPATEILRQTVMAPEAIHSAIASSTVERPQVEVTPNTPVAEKNSMPPQVELERLNKRAEQLSTPALLKAAESLIIEGVSVRRLYETNKIDRSGLVKIVQEGLSGGDIVHAFEKVELGLEAQAGRAREFRHDDPSFSALGSSNTPLGPPPPVAQTSALPNNPDESSLQPINIPAVSEHTPTSETIATQEPVPKTTEFAFAAIAAIAIVALILWALF